MVRYDESIIRRYTQNLYDHANLTVTLSTVAGVLLGGGGGWVVYDEIGMIVGAGVLGFVGYILGQARAFQLKLMAQLALCQVQIERNTRPLKQASDQVSEDVEEEYYSQSGVIVTNKRLVVPPNEWLIGQFQPVKVEPTGGKYRINLLDKTGRQVHYLDSDNQERIQNVAAAINKALSRL